MTFRQQIRAHASCNRPSNVRFNFSYLIDNFLNRFIHEWHRSTGQRCVRWPMRFLSIGNSFASFCAICGTYPRSKQMFQHGSPEYPLSAHKFCWSFWVGAGLSSTISSRVADKSWESCVLAASTTSDRGIPFASTSMLRLLPFFSPIRWIWPHGFGC